MDYCNLTNNVIIMTQKDPIKIFEKYYNEWVASPGRNISGYDYERTYDEMMKKVEKEIFQVSLGDAPNNKNRKKNSKPVMGK